MAVKGRDKCVYILPLSPGCSSLQKSAFNMFHTTIRKFNISIKQYSVLILMQISFVHSICLCS